MRNEASMKGGRTAPRNPIASIFPQGILRRFNEGGADCPPKPLATSYQSASGYPASMKGGRTAPRNSLSPCGSVGDF